MCGILQRLHVGKFPKGFLNRELIIFMLRILIYVMRHIFNIEDSIRFYSYQYIHHSTGYTGRVCRVDLKIEMRGHWTISQSRPNYTDPNSGPQAFSSALCTSPCFSNVRPKRFLDRSPPLYILLGRILVRPPCVWAGRGKINP